MTRASTLMERWDNITLGLDGLRVHKLRSGLTMLGMMFGVGAVISMLSIGAGAEANALELIERMGMHTADAIICVSYLTSSICERRYNAPSDKLKVVYNGVEVDERGRELRLARREDVLPAPVHEEGAARVQREEGVRFSDEPHIRIRSQLDGP